MGWWIGFGCLLIGAGLLFLGGWHWREGETFYRRAEELERQARQERKWIRERLAAAVGQTPEPHSVHLVRVSPELAMFMATPEQVGPPAVHDYEGGAR